MLDKLTLRFGSSLSGERLQLSTQAVNIFVGPNNSGKSTLLKEIEQYLSLGASSKSRHSLTVESIKVGVPSDPEELATILQPHIESEYEYPNGQDTGLSLRKYSLLDERGATGNFNLPKSFITNRSLYQSYGYGSNQEEEASCQIAYLFTIRLDGETRLSLVKNRDSAGYGERAKNVLVALLQDDKLREEVRRSIYDAVELYLSLDLTNPRTIVVKLSEEKPEKVYEIQWGEEARSYHSKTHPLASYGDGYKAFVGLTLATAIPNAEVFLVDEPEAFLHPPLAKKLGVHLSKLAKRQEIKMFISTHSADFLMGCIEADRDVNIVRLTYKAGIPTARLLDGPTISQLLNDPIMRQSNVLSGLFHEGVLLTEDDMDRVFYQEINARLKSADRAHAKDCLFLNFNGKDAMYKVVKPLRAMGIPTACLLDFDFIVDSRQTSTFSNLISCVSMPEATVKGLKEARQTILSQLSSTQRKQAKHKGVESFVKEQRAAVDDLLESLATYGIFVVPSGEIESFLPSLGEGRTKRAWFFSVMNKLGSDPDSAEYTKPGVGDVWEFMESVAGWLSNPRRKGIPA